MFLIGLILQVGILWFLITLFSRSTHSSQTLTETWIVVIGMLIVGVLTRWFLGALLGPIIVVIDVAALYFLVDKVCGTGRKATIKICGWYFGVSLLIRLFFAALA